MKHKDYFCLKIEKNIQKLHLGACFRTHDEFIANFSAGLSFSSGLLNPGYILESLGGFLNRHHCPASISKYSDLIGLRQGSDAGLFFF